MSKKKIIALAMSAVMAVGMIAGCGSTNNSGTDTAQTESTEKVTPTFMYFVANADDNFDATNTMYTELENEYKDKINFQLVNVDRHLLCLIHQTIFRLLNLSAVTRIN